MMTLAGKRKWTCELYLPWCWISRTTLLVLTFGWLQLRLAIHPDDDTTLQVLASVVVTRRMPLSVRSLARGCARFMAWLAYMDLNQPAGRRPARPGCAPCGRRAEVAALA
jgi:hypothetical protein